jgi:hypothetical protein
MLGCHGRVLATVSSVLPRAGCHGRGRNRGTIGRPHVYFLTPSGLESYVSGMARLGRLVAPGRPHHVTQRGHRRQGWFASFVMDEAHLVSAGRYVQRKAVTAGLVPRAED